MTEYSSAPGFAKIFYTVGTEQHVHQIGLSTPVGLIEPGNEPYFNSADGEVSQGFIAWMTGYVNLLKVLHNTSTQFGFAEYWSKPTPESDPVFIYATALAAVGTSASPAVADGQLTVTLRTAAGNLMRFVQMESIFATAYFDPAPIANVSLSAVMAHLISGATPFIARDNTKPIFALRGIGKVNDALRKRRLGL